MNLRDELVELERNRFHGAIERGLLGKFREDAKLSDEDWWERGIKNEREKSPEELELLKNDLLAKRNELTEEIVLKRWNDHILREVDRLLPYFEKLRDQKGVSGPIDFEDWERARRLANKAERGDQIERVKQMLISETNPGQRRTLQAFLTMLGAYEVDL